MKVTIKQEEENGVYSFYILCQLSDVNFGVRQSLETKIESKEPYTQLEKDKTVARCMEEIMKRYFREQERLNEKIRTDS